ncbi:MAG: hypothetical protein R3B06_31625 [Kofleriaceae bacterium]
MATTLAVATVALAIAAQRALATDGAPGLVAAPGAARELSHDHRALLRWMIVAAVAEAAIATALEFRFGAALKHRFAGSQLATAVSLFHGGTHALQLALQVLIIPRLLTGQRLPVTASIHPGATALGAAALVVMPGFAALAALRTGEKVFRSATARTGQEVTMSALPPAARARWKVLVRGVFMPIGAAAAGLILVALGPGVLARPVRFAVALAALAVIVAVALRHAAGRFVAILATPLGLRTVTMAEAPTTQLDRAELGHLIDSCGGARGAVAQAALVNLGVDAAELTAYLDHDDPAVREALYRLAVARPTAAATADLVAAVAIEPDPGPRAAGLAALAAHGARAAVAQLDPDRVIDPAVARAVRAARLELGLAAPAERPGILDELLAHDGAWAARLVTPADAPRLVAALGSGERRQALAAAAGGPAAGAALIAAVVDRDPAALAALAALSPAAAGALVAQLGSPLATMARTTVARAAAAAPATGALVAVLAADPEATVRGAALQTLVAHARAGAVPSAELAAAAIARARADLDALVAARTPHRSTAAARELDLAIRAATHRLVLAVAVATAVTGRDPLPLLAAGRRLRDDDDRVRRGALDLFQEVAAVPPPVLDALERSLRPIDEVGDAAVDDVEPTLAAWLRGLPVPAEVLALRRCRAFDGLTGPDLVVAFTTPTLRAVTPGQVLAPSEHGRDTWLVVDGVLACGDGTADLAGPGVLLGPARLAQGFAPPQRVAPGAATVAVLADAELVRAAWCWPSLGEALLRAGTAW